MAGAKPPTISADIVVGGTPELLHLYLPLAARDAGGLAGEAATVESAPTEAAPMEDNPA